MSYLFFEDILSELGKKLNYDAVVNFAGNSFCEKAWDMITQANPLTQDKADKSSEGFANFINTLVGG